MEKILIAMLDSLQYYKRDKELLLENYVKERLSKSIESYYKSLSDSLMSIYSRSDKKVVKAIGKE